MRSNVKVIGNDTVLPRVFHDHVRETTQAFLEDFTWRARQRELQKAQGPTRWQRFVHRLQQINYWALAGLALCVASVALTLYGLTVVADWMLGE